jgi:hypothetical protein
MRPLAFSMRQRALPSSRDARSKPNNIGAAPNLDDKGTAVVMDEDNIRARVVLLPDKGSHAMQE